jgi:hypothetical protein
MQDFESFFDVEAFRQEFSAAFDECEDDGEDDDERDVEILDVVDDSAPIVPRKFDIASLL